ncbi:hypothetical protein DRJ17_01410 [Candidatus Woesearchaeota archaeon]|nr:MAG: hypothetical protein DRJ17_01410 [Candidatus Woesearchaeota archaeon]
MTQIAKFGGSSLSTSEYFIRVTNIIKEFYNPGDIIIVSAVGVEPGDDGDKTTDELITLSEYYSNENYDKEKEMWNYIKRKHLALAKKLSLKKTIFNKTFKLAEQMLNKKNRNRSADYYHDRFAPIGECLSAEILVAILNNEENTKAEVIYPHKIGFLLEGKFKDGRFTQEGLDSLDGATQDEVIYVMPGYYGVNDEGDWLTIGRGGSDASAAAAGIAKKAKRIDIWTDVDGVYRANPKYFNDEYVKSQLRLDRLAYDEALQIAEFGATVIHPKAISTIIGSEYKPPVYIRKTNEPHGKYTIISDTTILTPNGYKGIVDCRLTRIILENPLMVGQYGFAADFFSLFKKHKIPIKYMSDSEIGITVAFDSEHNIERLLRDLDSSNLGSVEVSTIGLLGIYGRELRGQVGIAAACEYALANSHINIEDKTQSKERSMRFLIESDKRPEAVKAVYKVLEERAKLVKC